jgi:hypothetical protein
MSSISRKYNITIEQGMSGVSLSPLNDDIIIGVDRLDNEQTFRKSLKTDIRLDGSGFDYLNNIETSANRCVDIYLKVKGINCTFELKNLIKLNACLFNPDRCEAVIRAGEQDNFQCFKSLYSKEKNILSVGTKYTAGSLQGQIEYLSGTLIANFVATNLFYNQEPVSGVAIITTFATYQTWTAIYNRQYNFNPATPSMTVFTIWAREKLTDYPNANGTPIGNGWVNLGAGSLPSTTNWARPIQRTYDAANSFSNDTEISTSYQINGVKQDATTSFEYSNGVKLKDAIDNFLSGCSTTVVSDFYGINPDNTHPSNIAYDYALAYLQDILIYQKSDVRLPDANQDATKGIWTLEKLMKHLGMLHNVGFSYENNTLRIEHVSYFENQNNLDLTASVIYKEYIAGTRQYEYLPNAVPQFEYFKFMEQTDFTEDFDGFPIEYGSNCATLNEKSYVLENVTNNIGYISAFPNKISDYGFCIVATKDIGGSRYIIGLSKPNDVNGFKLLHPNLFRHQRYQTDFKINNSDTTALSTTPIKKGVSIEIPMCCADFDAFKGNKRVKTYLGWGTITDMSYSLKRDMLRLDLNY